LLIVPGEFNLHWVRLVIESHQLVYLQSTSDTSVEILIAKERRRKEYNKTETRAVAPAERKVTSRSFSALLRKQLPTPLF
jgi:hypothetical protein